MAADIIGITPHAHLLCKEIKVDATLPDGKPLPLIWIKDWDFNWQGTYQYVEPVHLPKGTRVEMRYEYDNSAANLHNPSNPPRRVTFGEQTTDEMAVLFLKVVLPTPEDVPSFRREAILSRINEFLLKDNDPVGLPPATLLRLRTAVATFDRNHDGKLDEAERQALLDYIAPRLR